ncbi:hypothetical protein [Falsibacillus albus]|uniref:Uncharacterized protein n=1 Tax=Falsibacillus albus TaxID=2478915 RepID=A0A3L7K697_9BACI|nr:hypothetical protein [Falsibacillus albus]RLQ96222.1 hypothetical protein D9X91_08000 [Falsibacillus albus]
MTSNKVIKVGTPIENGEGFQFNQDITDEKKIETLERIFKELQPEQNFNGMSRKPDSIFSLNEPEEHVALIWASLWYLDNDTAIAFRNQNYYRLSKKQTRTLKSIFE